MADIKGMERQEVQFQLQWGDPSSLDQVFVDQLAIQSVEERFYLTFGQIRMPLNAVAGGAAPIQPMVRLIVSTESLQRMVEVLRRSVPPSPEKK